MNSTLSWDDLYETFPVNRELIWLNNCGTTPAGLHVLQVMSDYLEGYSRKGTLHEGYSYSSVKSGIQTILARLLNVEPYDIAIIHNTSEGMNLVSHGLQLKPGDEILLLQDEYPSNVYPWQHWRKKQVRLSFIPMADTPGRFLENVKQAISKRTRLIALSAVHWCTGMPLPVKELGSLCLERGIGLVVDGAQGVGHVDLDVTGWNISFMAFSAWKWLLGPLGLGVLVIPREKLSCLDPVFKGTESVVNDGEYLPYKDELKPSAERYMYSSGNINDWVYFKASLDLLSSIGFKKVMSRIYELAHYLSEILRKRGFRVLSDSSAEDSSCFNTHTGIVVAEKKGATMGKLVNDLSKHGIITTERLGRIRFSPHIYNSFEQLDRVGEVLGAVLQ